MVVDIEIVKVKKDLLGVVLVDLWDSDCYLGKYEFIDFIVGYILGVINYFWK